jgi:dethiobiotin synthetase
LNVATFKPLCSGGRADARALHAALAGAMTLDEINPWHFRAPLAPLLAARRERKEVTLPQVAAHIRKHQKKSDVTLVEGAGGLLSPLGEGFDSRDLLTALRATPIIVATNKLGVVNHIRLTLETLSKEQRREAWLILMSPSKPDAATRTNAGLLAEYFPAKRTLTLPWLGKHLAVETALKKPAVKRELSRLPMLR